MAEYINYMLKPLYIGPYKLKSNVLLAPMAGVTDRAYREICRSFGAGLTTAEMISSDVSLWKSKKTAGRLISPDEEEPRSVQIVGTDPLIMADAARHCVDLSAQIIDINFGCPAKKVYKKSAGSALMQHPDKIEAILKAVTSAVNIPVTFKMRTGWNDKNKNALEIAKIAENYGIAAIYIHGRTRQQGYSGHSQFETIRKIKQTISIPVIANGDIKTPSDAEFALNYTNADGIMLGRVTRGQPWFFQEVLYYLQHHNNRKSHNKSISKELKIQTAIDHFSAICLHNSTQPLKKLDISNAAPYFSTMSVTQHSAAKKKYLQWIFAANTPDDKIARFAEALTNLSEGDSQSYKNPRLKNKGNLNYEYPR